jgi:hypothetical protein
MPRLEVNIPHRLGQEEALRRMMAKADFLQKTYGAQASQSEQAWTDNVLDFKIQAMGFKINGNVTVVESEIRLSAELPMMAMAFKSVAERRIRQELEQMVA